MFEEESKEYANKRAKKLGIDECTLAYSAMEIAHQKGAESGYNKANEWHYVKDELPKESGKYLVWVGGVNGVFVLDFDTEANDFGYWCVEVASASLGVTDTIFETVTERNEDKVIAWKEIVLPENVSAFEGNTFIKNL